jgi:hypothetical protein
LLSMESPAREDSPRVTRRRTTDGDNPPPLEFDKGWSSFRGKKLSAGLFSSLPLACVTPPTHLHIPTLGLSFAITIIAAPPVHQGTLPASSVETSSLGVLSISLPSRTTPRLESLTPYTALTSGRRVSLPATSSKKSRAGVLFALRPTYPTLPHRSRPRTPLLTALFLLLSSLA